MRFTYSQSHQLHAPQEIASRLASFYLVEMLGENLRAFLDGFMRARTAAVV